MKQLFTLLLLCAFAFTINAQESKWPEVDVSNMDAEYYPSNVAWRNYLSGDDRTATPKIRLIYSRPVKNDRDLFGTLVKYGSTWRMGANEANEITFYQTVSIGGTTVERGTYTMFAKVMENEWEVMFSSQMGIWGAENTDASKVVASVKVPVMKASSSVELLSMSFRELDERTAGLNVQWGDTRVEVPVGMNPVVFEGADKSPMDKAHYPGKSAYTNYLKGEEVNITPKIQVTYSRPYKKGRDVFGTMLKVGDIWRVGANQSTEILFMEDVTVGDKEIKAGRYALYAELKAGSWDMIFSKDLPSWGTANRDEEKDVARVNIKTSTESEVVENLSIIFEEKSDKKVHMVIAWDKTRAEMPIMFK